MQKAIIASNIDGINDLITNHMNGLLVEPNNVEELSLVINKLINDRSLREKLALAAGPH